MNIRQPADGWLQSWTPVLGSTVYSTHCTSWIDGFVEFVQAFGRLTLISYNETFCSLLSKGLHIVYSLCSFTQIQQRSHIFPTTPVCFLLVNYICLTAQESCVCVCVKHNKRKNSCGNSRLNLNQGVPGLSFKISFLWQGLPPENETCHNKCVCPGSSH